MIKDEVKFPIFSSSKILPASATVAEACSIPFGFVFDPNLPQHDSTQDSVKRCLNCKAYINKFCSIAEQSWNCIFCKQENRIEEKIDRSDVSLEKESYTITVPGDKCSKTHIMFVIDDYLNTSDKIRILSGMMEYIELAPETTLVSVFLLSSALNIYMVGRQSSPVQSEVFSGKMTRDLYQYLTLHTRHMLCNLATSRPSLLAMLSNMISGLESKRDALALNPPFMKRSKERLNKGEPKCLGFMFELILAIISQDTKVEAVKHILLFTGGELPPPTLPPPSEVQRNKNYFASLGASLSKAKTATHVHCIGNAVYSLDKMETMIEKCGGSISWQTELAGEVNVARCVNSAIGYDCVIRLQTSDNIALRNVSGDEDLAPTCLFTKRYPVLSRDKKFSAIFEIGGKINTSPVYLQCTNSYTDYHRSAKVTNVSTVRYDCLVDHDEIMAALCPDTIFTLAARAHVARVARAQVVARAALQSNTSDTLSDCDLVREIRSLVSSSERSIRSGVKGLVIEYLEKIYFLLNGPLISRMSQHSDMRHYIQHVICRAGVKSVSHLFKPRLYVLADEADGVTVTEFPPVTPLMQPDRILVIDSLTQISVWVGAHLNGDRQRDLLPHSESFVADLVQSRFPRPSVLVVHDETASNRFIECFLMPLHKDSREVQNSILPHLADLEDSTHRMLMARYQHIGSQSFQEWLHTISNCKL